MFVALTVFSIIDGHGGLLRRLCGCHEGLVQDNHKLFPPLEEPVVQDPKLPDGLGLSRVKLNLARVVTAEIGALPGRQVSGRNTCRKFTFLYE